MRSKSRLRYSAPVFCLVAALAVGPAVAVGQEWVVRFDDTVNAAGAKAMTVDPAGFIVVAGFDDPGADRRYRTFKYDASGNEMWTAVYDGPQAGGNDEVTAIVTDSAGNVYVTGFSPGSGTGEDIATVKYSSAGTQLCAMRYPAPGDPTPNVVDKGMDIAVDGANNVYVTGESGGDCITIKYNSDCSRAWKQTYDGAAAGYDACFAIAVGSGAVYVTGTTEVNLIDDDYLTIKYNTAAPGSLQWSKTYDRPGQNGIDVARDVALDGMGNVIVTGDSDVYSQASPGLDQGVTTLKYNTIGTLIVPAALYDRPGKDTANRLVIDGAGNVHVGGGSSAQTGTLDALTLKYDDSLSLLWDEIYATGLFDDEVRAIDLDNTGNVYVTGGGGDYVTVKYDPTGNREWIQVYGFGASESRSIAVTGVDVVYVTGQSNGGFATLKYSPAGGQYPSWVTPVREGPGSVVGRGQSGLRVAERNEEGHYRSGVPTFERSNYIWPYAAGPFYGEADAPSYRAPGVLYTPVGSFRLAEELDLPRALKTENRLDRIEHQYFIVQVDTATGGPGFVDSVKQKIESNGGRVVGAMPVACLVARLGSKTRAALEHTAGVHAIAPYHPAFKLDPGIGRFPLLDPVKALSDTYELDIRVFEGEDPRVVADAVARMGGKVRAIWPDTVRAELHRSMLAALAALEPVQWIFEHLPVQPHGEETTTTVQTGRFNHGATPYHDAGVDGGGGGLAARQVLMVLDSGIQLDAGDLSDTRTDAGTPGTGHRKVLEYTDVNPFGGAGDRLGCDASVHGGVTHGHLVAATALGNATKVDPSYGEPWLARDDRGNPWGLDGVAPGALLVAYDAQVTPSAVSCADPMLDTLQVGDLYSGGTTGSLGESYSVHGASTFNLSWGSFANVYGSHAMDVDEFMADNPEAMVFISAGNYGWETAGVPASGTLGTPATTKNGLAIGASGNANDLGTGGSAVSRARFSSVGPAVNGSTVNRVAPQLMAPGADFGSFVNNMGLDSEFACRSTDNDQLNPVECEIASGLSSTSFSSAAVAGAALLLRDYFAQGFYPDGTGNDPDNAAEQVDRISGALVKALLVASAEWMPGVNLTETYRFNNEQGYGRIQLDNVLPLERWPSSPSGLIVHDGGDPGNPSPANDLGLPATIDATSFVEATTTFDVCNDAEELRVVLTWLEDSGALLVNDLHLELTSPGGSVYYGNYFTDDNDRDGRIVGTEDCPGIDGFLGELDSSQWSLPACANSPRDVENPIEGIFLSAAAGQLEVGKWTLKVISAGTGTEDFQPFAVVVAGGVCLGSAVKLDAETYACNDDLRAFILEVDDPTDFEELLDSLEISGRLTLHVLDGGSLVDYESVIPVIQETPFLPLFRTEKIPLTDQMLPVPDDNILQVRHGNTILVEYADETNGSFDATKLRTSTANVECAARIGFGNVTLAQFGRDEAWFVNGGCERNERNKQELGFPDRYMDAGESLVLSLAVASHEEVDLEDATVSLRCVLADDGLAPEDCRPASDDCLNPDRETTGPNPHTPCGPGILTITNSPIAVPSIPARSSLAFNFNIRMAPVIAGSPEVELVLEVTSPSVGLTTPAVTVSRHRLDVDEESRFYSTDYPMGGTEFRDRDGDEELEELGIPTTSFFFDEDYRFEIREWSDLTAGGTKNLQLQSPWNFDGDYGGFLSGLGAATDVSSISNAAITQWGEDRNFNGVLDPGEDQEPTNSLLDRNWSTQGGCGWQTTSGIWHTGAIGNPAAGLCLVGDQVGQCQAFETVGGDSGQRLWFELLVTPMIEKVNDDDFTVEILNFAWNQAVDLPDHNVAFTWEFDTDAADSDQVDLIADMEVLNFGVGPWGAQTCTGNPALGRGYSLFAPIDAMGQSSNGTAGNNREGHNGCFFEDACADDPGLARPPDDDIDNDSDGSIDETVFPSGPIRNMDLSAFNGPDMRFDTLEDIYGATGDTFQAAIGLINFEKASADDADPERGYGVGVDDVVVEWREYSLVDDAWACTTDGSCASLDLETTNFFEGRARLAITVLDEYPSPPPANDCNGDGDTDDTGDDNDCNNNGTPDVVVIANAESEVTGERVILDAVEPGDYRGELPISSLFDTPGVLFVRPEGTEDPTVTVRYKDGDDGTGQSCKNHVDPMAEGWIEAATTVFLRRSEVVITDVRLSDNGDDDQWADSLETVEMWITFSNKSGADLTHVTAHLVTRDPNIDCIVLPTIFVGDLAAGEERESVQPFQFRVGDADRTSLGLDALDDFSARFEVVFAGDGFDGTYVPQYVDLDLDLDAFGGSGPTFVSEDFEDGFGQFEGMNLDETLHDPDSADGHRCQYSDPDWIYSNTYRGPDCLLGANPMHAEAFHWQIDGPLSPDGGRSFSGSNSLYMGVMALQPGFRTTPLGVLEAVQTVAPIALGWGQVCETTRTITCAANPDCPAGEDCVEAAPELVFKQQVSLADSRLVGVPLRESADRGVVQVQLADETGTPVGDWIKIDPSHNIYDQQATDNMAQCMFDPVDDGNTEADWFDPADPDRRQGPSSTCFPQFGFVHLGDTAGTFEVDAIGNASDGPGLAGATGIGTWVESRFNLERYRGRRIRIRFLNTAMQVGGFETWEQLFGINPHPGDDGWWIDDVLVTDTLSSPAVLVPDDKNLSGLPECPTCTTVNAVLEADPVEASAPGRPVELSAAASTADVCTSGPLEFQFWIDENRDDIVGDPADTRLRGWTDDPSITAIPAYRSTVYGVEVRCSTSTEPACSQTALIKVPVHCPPFLQLLAAPSNTRFDLSSGSTTIDWVRGTFESSQDIGNYAATFQGTPTTTSLSIPELPGRCSLTLGLLCAVDADCPTSETCDPAGGVGLYYLVKKDGPFEFCNGPTWRSGGFMEVLEPARNAAFGDPGP